MVKLHEVLDVDLLKQHVNERLVGVQRHPSLPLLIYNYTQRAQFAGIWNDGTIDYCRGLIVDDDNNVVARPFKKFHNLNTSFTPETMEDNLPTTRPNVTEKMDGSLGILWRYENNWGVATRGSFTSNQSRWATNWYGVEIAMTNKKLFDTAVWTPLFEIVYDENRIVCQYDFEGLVLLGMVEKKTGYERPQYAVEVIGELHGFNNDCIVKNYGRHSVQGIVQETDQNREGYVLTFDQGEDRSPLKVKVKFEEYVRLHRIVTGVSPKAIWELLATRQDQTFVKDMPKHFRSWAENWITKLTDEKNAIRQMAELIYINRPIFQAGSEGRSFRADCAAYFKREVEVVGCPGVSGLLFAMLDGATYGQLDEMAWKLVKPRGDDQSFRKDGE